VIIPSIRLSIYVCMDVVIASDRATFHVPFTSLALTPEACSSHTFPRIMGNSMANEMLLFNRKLSAEEALSKGFVSQVLAHDTLESETTSRLSELACLPSSALQYSKALIRGEVEKTSLRELNRRETSRLQERWVADEVYKIAAKFLSRRKK